jgi:hypothetical protein
MNFDEAVNMLREIRKGVRATENSLRENTGYIAQIGRLGYEYADGEPSARGNVAEGKIAKDLIDALGEIEAATKRLISAGNELARARDAAQEAGKQRAQTARRLKV